MAIIDSKQVWRFSTPTRLSVVTLGTATRAHIKGQRKVHCTGQIDPLCWPTWLAADGNANRGNHRFGRSCTGNRCQQQSDYHHGRYAGRRPDAKSHRSTHLACAIALARSRRRIVHLLLAAPLRGFEEEYRRLRPECLYSAEVIGYRNVTSLEQIVTAFTDLISEGRLIMQNCGYGSQLDFGSEGWRHWPPQADYLRVRARAVNLVERVCGEKSAHYRELGEATPVNTPHDTTRLAGVVGVLGAAKADFE